MDTQARLEAVLAQMVLTLFFLQLHQLVAVVEQTVQLALLVVQVAVLVKPQALQELVDQELQIKVMQVVMVVEVAAVVAVVVQMPLVVLEIPLKQVMAAVV
jgi:hypothetical protein